MKFSIKSGLISAPLVSYSLVSSSSGCNRPDMFKINGYFMFLLKNFLSHPSYRCYDKKKLKKNIFRYFLNFS